MDISEHLGVWIIRNTDGINIFAHPDNNFYRDKNPRLKPDLHDWMNENCSGTWAVLYLKDRPCLAMYDKAAALRFKLTWSGNPIIESKQMVEVGAFYCPYIPLVVSSVANPCQEVPLGPQGKPTSTKF